MLMMRPGPVEIRSQTDHSEALDVDIFQEPPDYSFSRLVAAGTVAC